MAGDMRVRLLLELVNRLSAPARQAAADIKSVGAAAKAVQGAGTGALQRDLQQAGVAAKGARAALAEAGAAARDVGRSAAGATPLQHALAGVAEQARQADGALDAAASAARDVDGRGARALARELAGIPTAGSRSAEAMAAIAREANRLARVGPGQALRRDLAQVARDARRSNDALAELTRGVLRLQRIGPNQALRHGLAQIAREARRADDALNGVTDKARRLDQANIGSAMQRNLANIAREAERARKAIAGTNAEAARMGRQAVAASGSRAPSAAPVQPAEAPAGDGGGGSAIMLGRGALVAGGTYYAAREVARQTVGRSINFESAMADVKKKVDLPEGRDWSQIEREIDKAAMKYGRNRGEVAALTANLGASGVKFDELPQWIDLATKTGVSWDMTADNASGELMKGKAGLGWGLRQASDYADKVNALGDASNALERDIAEAFGRASGGAAAAGVSEDVTLSGLTALLSSGVQPEIGSRFFAQLAQKMSTAEKDPDKWAAAGLNAKAITKGMRTDTFDTMVKVLDTIASKADAAGIAVDIFGDGWWDEAMRMQRAIPEWRKMMELLNDPAKWRGSQQAALDVELSTTQNHLDRLGASVDKIADSFSRWALPPINNAVDSFVAGVESLNDRASIFEATMERIRAAAALDAGHDVAGGERKPIELPNKPVIDIKGATETEKKLVSWLSSGKSDRKFVSEYFHDVIFGREGGKDQRLAEARAQALLDHQQKLDTAVDRAIAAEREVQDKLTRLRHEREQARKMGIDTGVLDYQIGSAEADLADKGAATDAARANRRDHDRRIADAEIKKDQGGAELRGKLEILQRRQSFRASKDWLGITPPASLTRDLPDSSRLQPDGLPAVVAGFDATTSGVRAGYTEKPAPRAPTQGWRVSPDEAGGYQLPTIPDIPPRPIPVIPPTPAPRTVVLPQPPQSQSLAAPKFSARTLTGAAPQPEIPGAAGVQAPVSLRMASLSEMMMPPDPGATIMERLRAGIEAGRPQVEGAARGVGDGLRATLFGADLAPAGQAAMDSYAAGIAANGEKAVAQARAVAAGVRQALQVDMSGMVSGSSPRGRIGGSLHDIPTGGP